MIALYQNKEVFTTLQHCDNIYKAARTNAGLTQEAASELLHIAPRTLQAYEAGSNPTPPEVVAGMVEIYAAPHLDKWYCVNQCPLGYDRQVPTSPMELPQTALMLGLAYAESSAWQEDIQRIFQIAIDGQIGDDEVDDYVAIEERFRAFHFAYHALKMQLDAKLLKKKQRKTPERVGAHSGVVRR